VQDSKAREENRGPESEEFNAGLKILAGIIAEAYLRDNKRLKDKTGKTSRRDDEHESLP